MLKLFAIKSYIFYFTYVKITCNLKKQRRFTMREYGDLNGDEDDIAYENQLMEQNNPNDEPNFDDWEVA